MALLSMARLSKAERVVDPRRWTTLFPRPGLAAPELSVERYRFPGVANTETFNRNAVVWVRGDCGCGKSTRVPLALLGELEVGRPRAPGAEGIAHCIPTNTAVETIYQFYQQHEGDAQYVACRWHSEGHTSHVPPRSRKFVALCTPASLYHLLQHADAWEDIRFLILDEVHKKWVCFCCLCTTSHGFRSVWTAALDR